MHRKVKGLLSVILTFAMVTVAVAPVSADELPGEQQPVETQPVIEMTESEEEPVEQDMVQEPAAKGESVEQDAEQEPAAEGGLTAADIVFVAEQLMTESRMTPAEREAAAIAFASASEEEMFNYLYGKLTEDQKKFRVFVGTDISSESTFLNNGVVPDDTTSQNVAISDLRKGRDFYTLSGWKLWKVDSNGAPENTLIKTDLSTLNKVATEANFKQAVYIENNGTGTNPEVLCQQPILEPVWSVYTFSIPAYDIDGNLAGNIDINVENYPTRSFPNIEGVYWKMIYDGDGTECRLKAASEIWTNDTNGIEKIGFIKFDASKAKLQAYIDDSVPEGPQYVTTGDAGKNGWYTSDVTISAKEGYEVRLSETDEWKSAVSVTESGTVTLYVKAVSGAELPAETLNFSIDKTAPVISGVEDGQTYCSNEIQVVVTDEHLQTVTKNNGDEGVYDNTAYITLNPSEEPYTIFAEDAAGNQTICNVSVKQPEKQEGTAEFTQPDWQEGQPKPAPIVSSATNGTDHITYYYKERDADASTYTTVEPTMAGEYTAKAVFAATELYKEVVKETNFKILPKQVEKQEGTAEFTQPDWHVGQEKPAPIVSSITNGVENITYYYKEQGAEDSTYTTIVPSEAGKYTAKAVFAATELYNEVEKISHFEILPKLPVEEVDEIAPVISGVEDGKTYYGDQTVTITDEHLSTVTLNGEPLEVSNNRVDITLKPSEDVYKIIAADEAGNQTLCIVSVRKLKGTAEFTQPGWRVGEEKPTPIVSSVTNGVENITYYYKEQGAEESAYTTTVPNESGKYTAKAVFAATELYDEVVKTSDFEILPKAPVVEKVDEIAPVISGVTNGQTYYGDRAVTVTDEHLSTVTVNGESLEVSNNRASITLKPSEDVYKIIAADQAGNKTEYTVEVLETWVRDGITTNGKKSLKHARMYKLGDGSWTVSGDNTVYTGGGSFYVKNGGEYDFKKK